MAHDISKFKLCKYKITNFVINFPTYSYKVITKLISGLQIEKLYDEEHLPLIKMNLSVPKYIEKDIMENQGKITATFRLQYAYFDSDDASQRESYANKNIPMMDEINQTFFIYTEDKTPDLNEYLQAKYDSVTRYYRSVDGGGLDPQHSTSIPILLYNSVYMNNVRTNSFVQTEFETMGNIISQCNLVDALLLVIKAAKLQNIIMSPPTNFKTYREFVITPIPAIEAIARICKEYGIYSEGAIVFFDYQYGYILRKIAKCTAYRPGEITKTYLVAITTKQAGLTLTGCYEDRTRKENICAIQANKISVSNTSGVMDQITGVNVAVMNKMTGEMSMKKSGVPQINGAPMINRVMMINKGDDTTSQAVRTAQEAEQTIELISDCVNMQMFSPNKEFIFSPDSANYSKFAGSYRISKVIFSFTNDGDYFNNSATITLKK